MITSKEPPIDMPIFSLGWSLVIGMNFIVNQKYIIIFVFSNMDNQMVDYVKAEAIIIVESSDDFSRYPWGPCV